MEKNFKYDPGAEYPYQYRYEHMAVTTDCVIFTYENRQLKVLLIRRGIDPFKGFWALPGGFLNSRETAQEGALRELREETGLIASSISELGVFSNPNRDPRERCISIAFYALIKPSNLISGDDADDAAWFSIDLLPELAFDHKIIIDAAIKRLRKDIYFEPVGFDLLDDTFSIPDLQHLYEIILNVKFDRRNFYRKIMASGILEEINSYDSLISYSNTLSFKEEELHNILKEDIMELNFKVNSTPNSNKRVQGRTASLFRLNKVKYDKMKEDSSKREF